jgi:hypothetical protein
VRAELPSGYSDRTPEQLARDARGHDLLVRNAARFFQIGIDRIDPAKFETVLAEHAGKNAKTELLTLRADPEIRKYLELSEPAVFAKLADQVAEQIDRPTGKPSCGWARSR